MSEQSAKFDFCPKCGALARNGVCQSCGYHMPQSTKENKTYQERSNYDTDPQNQNQGYGQQYQNQNQGYGQQYQNQNQGYGQQYQNQNQGYGQQYQNQNQGYGQQYQNQNQGYGQQYQNQNQSYGQQYQDQNQAGNAKYVSADAQYEKKQNTGLIVALVIVGTLFALVLIAIVIFVILVIKAPEDNTDSMDDSYISDDYSYGDNSFDQQFGDSSTEGEDPYLSDDYENRWGTDHENHSKSEFTGDYYEAICECIDEDVDYKLNRKYYEYYSDNKNVAIRVAYYELEGNIPNLDSLNEDILSQSAYFAGNYFEDYGDEDYDGEIKLYTDSYVTYNDDKVLSIVLDDNWKIDGDSAFGIYGLNIDLQNGKILTNNTILDMDEDFAKLFRERNTIQNETDHEVEAVHNMDDSKLLEYLTDIDDGIIFYTPLGMEVGFNYEENGRIGWVTVSFTDYEKYLKSL